MDPTVVATPFYFATMELERRHLRRRAETLGPSPADYSRDDTIASLSMGVASLLVPIVSHGLVRHVVVGKGKLAKTLIGVAAGAVMVTTVADRLAGHNEPDPAPAERRTRAVRRWAKHVARVAGPVAVGTGVVAITANIGAITSVDRMWRKGRHRDLGSGPLPWAIAFVGWDFIYYLNHRSMHEIRGMWAIHVVHHSSERYNLSTALRQPVADVLGLWVPYGLMARVGVRPSLIQLSRGWNLLYQYWIHTDTIRSLGPAEEIFNTPSHHRVHHGSNGKYIDRNHGGILIIWDRLLGTFQREEEDVIYGLTKNIETFNPLRVVAHEYIDMIRDVAQSTTWGDRLSYVLRGPGWAYRKRATRAAVGLD